MERKADHRSIEKDVYNKPKQVIKEVEERGIEAVTNTKAEPLIELILKHGLAVKLEESTFEIR